METLKECPSCTRTLPLIEFNWRDKERRRIQSYCRDCSNAAWRRWYMQPENRSRHLAQLSRRRRNRIGRNKAIVRSFKNRPCTDCGKKYPAHVMDLDHVRGKTGEIPVLMRTVSTARLLLELARCEVVCANCHRIRTFSRADPAVPGTTDGG